MMRSRLRLLVAGTAVVVAACGGGNGKTSTSGSSSSTSTTAAAAHPTVATATSATLGTILVDSAGRTLYVFDKDAGGKIACTASCVQVWPPLLVTPGTTPAAGAGVTAALATVQRPDGGLQVTLAGRPLYVYSGDSAPGQTHGDGFGGIWHAAKPAGNPLAGAASSSTSSTSSTSSAGY
jgi:predicted lipoprotein with Yx(FWY)xxD motif